jgi:hypothetical protein
MLLKQRQISGRKFYYNGPDKKIRILPYNDVNQLKNAHISYKPKSDRL